jgi:peroxiredoxin
MKKLFIPGMLCAAACFSGCHFSGSGKTARPEKFDSFAIIGKITGQDTGIVYIRYPRLNKVDSAWLDHGYFTFRGKADSPEYCLLGIGKDGEPQYRKSFFLENGKISMLVKKDSLEDALISGTPTQDEYNGFLDQMKARTGARSDTLNKHYQAARAKNDRKAMDSLEKAFDALDLEQKDIIRNFIKTHPASYVSALEIYRNFSYNPDADELDSLYKQLTPAIQSTYYGQKVNDLVKKAKLTMVGQPAPDFTANDTSGKPVNLTAFKGKYLLVDFWASWCGPCRQENPSVVKAYHRFRSKGFDILGVSLDDSKPDWEAAIRHDGLFWTQVSDLQGWKNAVAVQYGIQGIPMNYLLDREGKIIAKGLRGEELEKKLSEVLQ